MRAKVRDYIDKEIEKSKQGEDDGGKPVETAPAPAVNDKVSSFAKASLVAQLCLFFLCETTGSDAGGRTRTGARVLFRPTTRRRVRPTANGSRFHPPTASPNFPNFHHAQQPHPSSSRPTTN